MNFEFDDDGCVWVLTLGCGGTTFILKSDGIQYTAIADRELDTKTIIMTGMELHIDQKISYTLCTETSIRIAQNDILRQHDSLRIVAWEDNKS